MSSEFLLLGSGENLLNNGLGNGNFEVGRKSLSDIFFTEINENLKIGDIASIFSVLEHENGMEITN